MDFYKYISKRGRKYRIMYQGEVYGEYDDITLALYDRDVLVDSGWDITEALARNEIENKYKSMDLPEWDYDKFISIKRDGKRKYYVIRKTINGKQKFFGQYKTFEEAKKEKDKLIEREWYNEPVE